MNPNPSEPTKLAKGERVECVHNGTTIYGAILRSSGGKATMVLDGGKQSLTGPISCFKPSSHPLPADPITSEADSWSVTDFNPFNGRDDCVAFEATLCRDGQPVLRAYNSGIHGTDQITPLGSSTRLDVTDFRTAVKSWLAANGMQNLPDPAHLWIVWYVEKRPFGIPSAAFLQEMSSRRSPLKN